MAARRKKEIKNTTSVATPSKSDSLKKRRRNIGIAIDKAAKNIKCKSDYEHIIRLSKEYSNITTSLQLEGVKATITKLRDYNYWAGEYDKHLKDPDYTTTIIKKLVTVIDTPEDETKKWTITLCWTIQNDYCICDSIIKSVQDYLIKMNSTLTDKTTATFSDRVEHHEIYHFEGSEEAYKLILKSAEYILDIVSGSMHEKCNVGIF